MRAARASLGTQAGDAANSAEGSAKARVQTFLGLHWQAWASIVCTSGGILLLFYVTKGCCPFWAWSLTIMKLGWTLMGLAWCG